MRGLTILVAGGDPERYRAALSLAAAQAAAGGAARLYLHETAVALLAEEPAGDARYRAAGLPGLRALEQEALGLGVALVACQTGLALAGLRADGLDARIEAGGLVGLIASLRDDRLVTI